MTRADDCDGSATQPKLLGYISLERMDRLRDGKDTSVTITKQRVFDDDVAVYAAAPPAAAIPAGPQTTAAPTDDDKTGADTTRHGQDDHAGSPDPELAFKPDWMDFQHGYEAGLAEAAESSKTALSKENGNGD